MKQRIELERYIFILFYFIICCEFHSFYYPLFFWGRHTGMYRNSIVSMICAHGKDLSDDVFMCMGTVREIAQWRSKNFKI